MHAHTHLSHKYTLPTYICIWSTTQRTKPSAPCLPSHTAAPYIALKHRTMQPVVLRRNQWCFVAQTACVRTPLCIKWCFVAQPRCNELPFTDRIHKTHSQLSQASPTSAPLDTPTSAPGLAHIQGGPSPHLRREHLLPGPLLREGRRLRATGGGRMPGTCSKHSRCSSCRCSG